MAILEYLDTRSKPEPPILPKRCPGPCPGHEIAYAIACDIHPVNNLRLGQYLKSEIRLSVDEQQVQLAAPLDQVSASRHWRRC